MIDTEKDAFHTFARQIIESKFPDELLAFDIEGGNLIQDIYDGKDIRRQVAGISGEFQFLAEATSILTFIGLIWSTYEICKKMLTEFKDKGKSNNLESQSISALWKNKLIESGISEDKASEIIIAFSSDLSTLLKIK